MVRARSRPWRCTSGISPASSTPRSPSHCWPCGSRFARGRPTAPGTGYVTAALGVAAYFLRTAGIAFARRVVHRPRPSADGGASNEADRAPLKSPFKQAGAPRGRRSSPDHRLAGLHRVSHVERRVPPSGLPLPATRLPGIPMSHTWRTSASSAPSPQSGTDHGFGPNRALRDQRSVYPSLAWRGVTAQRDSGSVTIRDINRHAKRELPARLDGPPSHDRAVGLVILAGAVIMLRRRQWLLPLCCATGGRPDSA